MVARIRSIFLSCATIAMVGSCPAKEMNTKDSTLSGQWRVSLQTLEGWLDFKLDVQQRDGQWIGVIVNGPERIEVPLRHFRDGISLSMPYYDSEIRLQPTPSGMVGTWRKQRGEDDLAVLKCKAEPYQDLSLQDPSSFLGRWAVRFSDSDQIAVGIFQRFGKREVVGTFLTTTGDYRYLHGAVVDDQLTLSCFDGAHSFLFTARLEAPNSISGKFMSGNWHQAEWSAVRDDQIALPDAFSQTHVVDERKLAELAYPDLSGELKSLAEVTGKGKVTLIEIFGSWCPNCHDAAAYLSELRDEYGDRGLHVLGLAFELTGSFERDARQVNRYIERFDIDYPVLIAGTSDKTEATERFPVLDRIRSYPTILFVDQVGNIRAVYTGFSGPATGEAHLELRKRFESLIEAILAE